MSPLENEQNQPDSNVVGDLFGRSLYANVSTPFSEQIFNILADLIHQGHWEVGDRLPSITDLSEQCGISRSPVQFALNQLAEKGYIRQESRRGSFVNSKVPTEAQGALPSVGLLMAKSPENIGFFAPTHHQLAQMHLFQKVAARRNYLLETAFVEPDADNQGINTPSGPFGDRVRGIFDMSGVTGGPNGLDLSGRRVPVVYLNSGGDGVHVPALGNDTWYGMYQVTKRVIAAGHRNIVVFCDPPFSVPIPEAMRAMHRRHLEANLLQPHRQAMAEAGLEANEDAIEASIAIPISNLAYIRDFLEQFADSTCVIALRDSPMNVISVAELLGRKVPEDLSVVAGHTGPFPMRPGESGKLISGACHISEAMVEMGFELLSEIQRTGTCQLLRGKMLPQFVEGCSLAAPGVLKKELELAGV